MAEVLAAAVRDRQWVPDEPLEIEVEREVLTARPGDRAGRPGPGPPHRPAAQPGPRGVRRGDRARPRRPGGRADRRRPAGRGEPARRGRPGGDPPRAARGDRRSRPRWTGCGRCSPRSGCSPTCTPTRSGSPPPRRAEPTPSGPCCAASRAGGRRPTCRCWTRPPSCSARTTGPPRPAGNRIRALEREYAEGVLEIARGSRSIDVEDEAEGGEILGVTDLIDADRLLERQEEARPADHRPARRRRPELGVRPRHRRRGAGAVADGVAAADAPLPEPVHDDRRGRGADRRAGRHARRGPTRWRRTWRSGGGWRS